MSKRSILTIIIIPMLLITGLIIFLINNQREYPGELVLSEERLDFGPVPEWKGQITQMVNARNIGKSPIHITSIQTGCSYVDIEGPKVISPDSDTTLKVLLDPQFMPDNLSTATAIVFTDSPKTPQAYLTIVANVQRFATLSAKVCDFGEILPEKMYEKEIKLCVNEPLLNKEIQILPIEHKILRWKLTPIPNTHCYTISIRLRSPKKDKTDVSQTHPFNAIEQVSTSLTIAFPNDRTLTLPIVAKVVEPVVAKPESLSYGIVQDGANPSLRFKLLSHTPIQILELQTPSFLKVIEIHNPNLPDMESLSNEKYFKVTLETTTSPKFLRENIQIKTSASPTQILIPVYGYIQSDQSKDPSSDQGSGQE